VAQSLLLWQVEHVINATVWRGNLDDPIAFCVCMASDGQIDPSILTVALVRGARNHGVEIHEGDDYTVV